MKEIFKFRKKETEEVIDPEKLEKRTKAKKILVNVGKAIAFTAGGALFVLAALAAAGTQTESVESEEIKTDEVSEEPNEVTSDTSEEVA